MLSLILILLGSTLPANDILPEIEITAPKFYSKMSDSVGMIPEIIIYGEKNEPQSVNKMIRTYDRYRTTYQQIFGIIWNYGILIVTVLFIMTFIIIVLVKEYHHSHVFVPRHQKESQLHRWVRKRHDLKYGNWNN